ncbi:MAG: FadR/GntR family transcriptional regulator [Desulfarculaceae bacterium]|jgi:DNA-binding FadR family transcriptional regulator
MQTDFEPISRATSLYEQVAQRIKEAILSGRFQSGEALPSETQLADQFGVSRPVVREAMRTLQSRGFLEIRRGTKGGAFVSNLGSLNIGEDLLDLISLRKLTVQHMSQARRLLEPEIVRLAVVSMTDSQIQELKEVDRESRTTKDDERRVYLNGLFHRIIARGCGNPFYEILMDAFMDFAEGFARTVKPVSQNINEDQGHELLCDALEARDTERAIAVAREHAEYMFKRMGSLEAAFVELQSQRHGAEDG